MSSATDPVEKDAITLPAAIAFHLLPGALLVSVHVALAPFFIGHGLPVELAYWVAALTTGVPFMLAVMAFRGKRLSGHLTLRGVIGYRRPMSVGAYILLYVPLLAIAFVLLFATAPINRWLATQVFAWLPPFLLPDWKPPIEPSRTLMRVALLVQLFLDGLAVPVVEELYFRGFLLPRISYLGAWAPLVNATLFAIQHFWQPYNWVLILLLVTAEVYVVWWRRNIYIAMLLHCSANTIGALLALAAFLEA